MIRNVLNILRNYLKKNSYETYDAALESGLQAALELIIKNKER